MALFDNDRERSDRLSGDAATRALSVTVVENDFVARVYEKLASSYDLIFGPTLHPGRLEAIRPDDDRAGRYRCSRSASAPASTCRSIPSSCAITGIDLSAPMLDKARERIFDKGLRNCRVFEMDAAAMTFADETFDIVYAPYLISVVPDPVKVATEMFRVCRRGGRIVILNHFKSQNPVLSRIETAISPLTVHVGFKSDLDLKGFLTQANLTPLSIEKVNLFKMWSLVTCVK